MVSGGTAVCAADRYNRRRSNCSSFSHPPLSSATVASVSQATLTPQNTYVFNGKVLQARIIFKLLYKCQFSWLWNKQQIFGLMECFKMRGGWMKAEMIWGSALVASAAMFHAVQWRIEGGWGVQTPPWNSEGIVGVHDRMSKKNRRLDFLLQFTVFSYGCNLLNKGFF